MLSFPFNAYLAALCGGFFATFLALPFVRRWCIRIGHVDDPGHRKIHDEPIALAGGIAVLQGILIPLALAVVWVGLELPPLARYGQLTYGLGRRALELSAIAVGAIGITILGWLDDRHELKPLAKFIGQFAVAALVAAGGARITLFVPNLAFSYAITILWIVTLVNAFNFMDNMNGLCAGLGVIGVWCFAVRAGIEGQYLVALMALLIAGALLGFLPWNFPRAKAFLGDAGSHLIGFLLAVLGILPHFHTAKNPKPFAVLTPLLVLAVPLLDLAWVVLIRWRLGKPFYVGDTNHLSHHLVRAGLSKTQAVLVIWLLAVAIGALSFV